ncbi:YneF family protein [Ammoniphilus sp. CFH 90114]|uniref:YneF family protein n=1 Tax=Ammoniphilus sp. CFH 90114 TaxID=2493665 RepID=UPI00100E7E50|nr:YneF family protein [Ammoniphilus sp. CFH 90114]RXT04962.1 YneF family protein [Ammoniphilus sp. CFH 90114]
MWNYIIPILTLILGLVGGFFGGVYYLKHQMTNMQMDEKQLQAMAKSMGMNLNAKQINQAAKAMKGMQKNKNFKMK